jgi:uncharacterized glyoxalase superfamily protein PhnB
MQPLTPYIAVADARRAIDWYVDAFGAQVTHEPIVMPDGRVGHVELSVGDGTWMMSDEHPEIHVESPDPGRGASVTMHLVVADVDVTARQAVSAGATLDRGPEDSAPVGRVAVLRDPFGHRWFLNQPLPPEGRDARAEGEIRLSQRWPGERLDPPRLGDEKAMLVGYLDNVRRTFELKCEDLGAVQLRARSVEPSTLSLHALARHLAGVERWWLRINFAGEAVPMLHYTDDEPDLDFEPPSDADPFVDLRLWREECDESRRVVAEHDLDDEGTMVTGAGDSFSLRWVLLRMIAEYAQHNGHADLLRERIDGRTGA